MEERITNIQVEDFLRDFEENSITEILEEGKEKNEVVAIAKAKGINLKDNTDLAGFKTIYTFADIANKNRTRLPKKALLKALPTMIGKPIDIDHNRRYVIGHYIDYRYRAKEDMVIAYGVFYKSNFGAEWKEAKKLFKKKKLATSYEIWCPPEKRRELSDGTFELLQQEIAGGALLFKEEPAFEDAKVLELAKKHSGLQPEDLIYAKKYKNKDLIMCKDNICEAIKCPITADITAIKVEEKKKQSINITTKIICSNCEEQFEYNGLGDIKCPKCFAILDRSGNMLYPPQLKDFKIMCPSCRVNRWLILSKCDMGAKLRCLHCSKEYEITFDRKKLSPIIDKFNFVYIGSVNCHQCNRSIEFSGVSSVTSRTLKCKKCGLEFSYDITRESYKRISKIEEIKKEQTSEKGGNKMAKEKKIEKKVEAKIEEKDKSKVEEQPKAEGTPKAKEKPKAKEALKAEEAPKTEEKVEKAEAPKKETPVKKEQPKVEEKVKKEKTPEKAEDHAGEKKVEKVEVKKEEVKVEKVEKPKVEETKEKKTEKAKEVKKDEKVETPKKEKKTETKTEKVEEPKKETPKEEKTKPVEKAKEEKPEIAELLKKGINKLATLVISLRKEIKKVKEDSEKKITFYKANAEEINARRKELNGCGKDLTDEAILDDKKFAKAKADKENARIEKSSAETVGEKSRDAGFYKKIRKEINKQAFPK